MPDRSILTPFFLDEPLGSLEAIREPGWEVNSPHLSANTRQDRLVALYRPLALEGVTLSPLPPEHIILTDACDLDPGEKQLVKSSGIIHLENVNQLANFPLPNQPLYVHFDVDVLDPQQAPAMSYPAPGGPSADQLEMIFKKLTADGQIAAVSMSTRNPSLNQDGKTAALCLRLLHVLLDAP